MVFVSFPASLCPPTLLLLLCLTETYLCSFFCSLLLGFVFPFMWYYATILYFGNYYRKDPRERAGLAASAIAVSGSSNNKNIN